MPSPVTQLQELVGPLLVSDDIQDRKTHSRDWSADAFIDRRSDAATPYPDCVVRPETTEQVRKILAWADETGTPVVPFGGGSGVVAGIRPDGGIVLDTGSMWQIVDLDEKSRLVEVEAGMNGDQLQEALATRGWYLGHQPQSLAISTVGGWVATRACGQLSARYGGIEDHVVGLEAVLPGGRLVGTKTAPRRSVGPDLASLMMGSEGTLGVVTRVTLRIAPLPGERVDRCLRFDHMAEGVAACRALAQSELGPTVVRLYDAEDAALFLRHHPGEVAAPLLILSFEGRDAAGRAEAASELGGRRGNDELVAHWWAHRNDAVAEFKRVMAGDGILGAHGVVDTMEVAGSWSILRDLYHSIKEALGAVTDLVACHLSHVYPDGACLYFTMASACEDDEEARRRLSEWWEAGMRACLSAGGSISHHHGIGRLKVPWLDEEMRGWWQVLKAVKEAVDPKRIMNPGVLGL